MQKIYAFGYNSFRQTNPESDDDIISIPSDITKGIQCDNIIWSNMSSTLGINNNEGKLIYWGFNDTENKVVSPSSMIHISAQNLVKCFGDDDGIQGYLDVNGKLHGRAENIFKFSAKCVDVDQMWTGNNVIVVTEDGKLWKLNLKNNEEPNEIRLSDESENLNPFFLNVVCGENHCLALTKDGEVYSWGSGRFGQLGHGELTDLSEKPTVIEFFQGLRVKKISCGGWHSAVITDSGDLYTFGWNHFGRLGISFEEGSTMNCAEPSLVEFFGENNEELNVLKVACGSAHTVVITGKLKGEEMMISDYGVVDGCKSILIIGKYGQLGLGADKLNDNYKLVPIDSTDLRDKKVLNCSCGRWNTFLIVD
ncbi:6656_t:CDS:2 [Funneliformis geosporum]|uniref:9974_t:CDS:1 n=1 Tax=Funneliformis geosporum TaxID=1117311 RepID=A0A9W4SRP7_9GLOM|nr:9974_t:CDS:2 [Funneliformis geosporum]CAI2185161.1 6656_t:CDS:2 [Funneliformis geosporum]